MVSSRAAHYEKARSQARPALELEDTNPLAYLVLGELAFQENDLGGAMDTWERGLRLNPDDRPLDPATGAGPGRDGRGGWPGAAVLRALRGLVRRPGRRAARPAPRWSVMEAAYRQVGGALPAIPRWPDPPGRSIPTAPSPIRATPPGPPESTTGRSAFRPRAPRRRPWPSGARSSTSTPTPSSTGAPAGASGPTWLNEGFADVARLRGDPGPTLLCRPSIALLPAPHPSTAGSADSIAATRTTPTSRPGTRWSGSSSATVRRASATSSPRWPPSRTSPRPSSGRSGQDYDSFARAFDAELR